MTNGTPGPEQHPTGKSRIAVLLLCGVFGGFIAAFADLMQKEHASAVLKIANTANTYLDVAMPKWVAFLFIAVVAGFVSLIFGADDVKKSFTTGLSALSIVMTAVPYTSPPTTVSLSDATGIRTAISEFVVRRAYAQETKPLPARGVGSVPIVLRLMSDRSAPDVEKVTVTVSDKADTSPIARLVFRKEPGKPSDGNLIRQVSFSLPPGDYSLRIEASGHRIVNRVVKVGAGGPMTIDVQMASTSIPLFLQRLGQK